MREHCVKCDGLCSCQDWKSGSLEEMVNHLINFFRFSRFELEYITLEPGETGRMLCCIGKCFNCGRRLCHGNELPADAPVDALLEHIYRWTFQLWHGQDQPSIHGTAVFAEIFLALFHEEDRPLVEDWLRRPETKQLRRSCHLAELED